MSAELLHAPPGGTDVSGGDLVIIDGDHGKVILQPDEEAIARYRITGGEFRGALFSLAYDYARPISMIRYLGQRGQLNEQPGIVETITEATTAPGERHAHLSAHIGEQAVYGWRGEPSDPATITSGVGWIRSAEWVPYQRASFVSPAFAAYVSGHSGFSRAAAEVLTELTGSPYFPGGLATHTVAPGDLLHEAGPTQTVTLQWATYRDAADQAGISRLYGGIHVPADDLNGRIMGADIGTTAVDHARSFFAD